MRSVAATPSPCRSRSSMGGSELSGASNQKELISLSEFEARQDALLGCSIRKSFGGQSYFGQVVSIDCDAATGERHYHVAYEDGDEEHLLASEVQPLMQPGRADGRFPGSTPVPQQGRPSGRPSFHASRAGTPRHSGASQASRPSFPSGAPTMRASLGGRGSDDNLCAYYAIAGFFVVAYFLVCGLPSCFSSAVTDGAQNLDTSSYFAESHVDSALWTVPSNDVILESLPASPISTFDVSAAHMPASSGTSHLDEVEASDSAHLPSEPVVADSIGSSRSWAPIHTGEVAGAQSQEDARIFEADSEAQDAGVNDDDSSWSDLQRTASATFEESWHIIFSFVSLLAGFVMFFKHNICRQRLPVNAGLGLAPDGVLGSPLAPGALLQPDGTPARQDPYGVAALASGSPLPPALVGNTPLRMGLSPAPGAVDPFTPARNSPVGGPLPMCSSPQAAPSMAAAPLMRNPVQVGAFYLANVGSEQKVVKTVMLNDIEGTVVVMECAIAWRNGNEPVFKVGSQGGYKIPTANLAQGPFEITGGRAPSQVATLFQKDSRPPLRGPSTPLTAQAPDEFHRLPPRFRFTSALKKMQEMGFEDSADLRQVLTACNGSVDEALREFWSSS